MVADAPRYYQPAPVVDPVTLDYEVAVYGGTPAGVTAAIQAARMGRKTLLLSFNRHVGGMTSGGLTATDLGKKESIGGLALDFYTRLGRVTDFSPSAAESLYLTMLNEAGVTVLFERCLESVEMKDNRIVSATMETGETIKAAMFIDATYEGDLLAAANVSYRVGREPRSAFNESLAGQWQQVSWKNVYQFCRLPDQPLRRGGRSILRPAAGNLAGQAGRAGRGRLPGAGLQFPHASLEQGGTHSLPETRRLRSRPLRPAGPLPELRPGHRMEAQLHHQPDDRRPGADAQRRLEQRGQLLLGLRRRQPSLAGWDLRAGLLLQTAAPAARPHRCPSAISIELRERIFQDHVTYQQGLLYFLANDPQVPKELQERVRRFGLDPNEFKETGHWPHQLYVREGRRMVSAYIMTQEDCESKRDGGGFRRPRLLPDGLPLLPARGGGGKRQDDRAQRGRLRARLPEALSGFLPRHRPQEGRMRQPAGAGLPFGVARRLRFHPHGAGVHDPRPERRHRRGLAIEQRSAFRTWTMQLCVRGCCPTDGTCRTAPIIECAGRPMERHQAAQLPSRARAASALAPGVATGSAGRLRLSRRVPELSSRHSPSLTAVPAWNPW